MRYIPILFSTPMVKAILDNRKIITRRVINPQPANYAEPELVPRVLDIEKEWGKWYWDTPDGERIIKLCPYGSVGDVLWGRETFVKACLSEDGEGPAEGEEYRYWYKADDNWTKHDWHDPNVDGPVDSPKWKPSIFMPKKACRLFLEIVSVRPERLQDITEQDAIAEGVQENVCEDKSKCISKLCKTECTGKGEYYHYAHPMDFDLEPCYSAVESFMTLWKSINGEENWTDNPWVWRIEFKKIDRPKDFLLLIDTTVQECDASKVDSSTKAK